MTDHAEGITSSCVTQWAWRTALNASLVAVTTGLALRYVRQPKALTAYAGGQVFRELPFTKGLIAGAILGPFVGFVKRAVLRVPCCWPVLRVWECARGVASGECIGSSHECGVVSVTSDIVGRAVALALLLGIQGALSKRKIYPDHTSMFCGFTAGSMATSLTISTALQALGPMYSGPGH